MIYRDNWPGLWIAFGGPFFCDENRAAMAERARARRIRKGLAAMWEIIWLIAEEARPKSRQERRNRARKGLDLKPEGVG